MGVLGGRRGRHGAAPACRGLGGRLALGALAFAFGFPVLGLTATAFALFAAFLNAAFGICLGCQLYPFVARLRRTPVST